MPIAYPAGLPLALRATKSRSQPAAFGMSMPRRGYGYVEPTGTDVPVFWDVKFLFTRAHAVEFQLWFVLGIARGVDEFEMPIRTEFGLLTHTCRFLPESLLPAREVGELFEYSATIMARAQLIPSDAVDAYEGAFVGPIPDQEVISGIAFTLNLPGYWSGGTGSGYVWSIVSGTLAEGLFLNSSSGVVSGTYVGPSASLPDVVFRRTDAYGIARDSDPVEFDAVAVEPDALAASNLILLLGQGTNGSTTFTDSSSYARSVSVGAGSPAISTAEAKFGSSSIYGGTSSPQLLFSRSGAEWAQNNWSWDLWYRRAANGNYHGLLYHDANLSVRLLGALSDSTYRLRLVLNGSAFLTSTSAVPLNTWTHVALSVAKVSTTYTVRLFVGGVLEATTTSTNTNLSLRSSADTISIGRHDSSGFAGLDGYVNGYRLTAATRWTADFTPPRFLGNYAAP